MVIARTPEAVSQDNTSGTGKAAAGTHTHTGTASAPPPPPVAGVADADPQEIVERADKFAEAVLAGRYVTLSEATIIKENALALKHMLAVRQTAGELVSKAAVVDAVFNSARQQRDIFLNWPSRIGPLLAADLNCDAGQVTGLLSEFVHELCMELSGVGDTFEVEDAP